jgi:hypothetical protein
MKTGRTLQEIAIELDRQKNEKRDFIADEEKGSVISHLISGADLSCYGLSNAITRASQDVRDYDRATEMGGQVIELSGREWQSIASLN